jgi:hypothetical protein
MPTLPARDLDRLVKLCGLLTSDADGERATAARMASDLLRQHRLTWAEQDGDGRTSSVRIIHQAPR